MENLQHEHNSGQWMFFIVSPKFSFKAAVLIHNGNKVTFVPLVQAVHMREKHECLLGFLPKIPHYEHRWNTCDDLTVIAMTVYTRLSAFNVKRSADRGTATAFRNSIRSDECGTDCFRR
jgi:hypothetical protein